MATIQKNNTRKVNKLRYAEYYDQQPILDGLYAKSAERTIFDNLMPLITSETNILQAYRAIKRNKGSNTAGTDGLTIKNIERLNVDELCAGIRKRLSNYCPKAVRRKDIPKPNGKTRPLGIPCIWDRLVQQSILQVLEPICEAKFSENSYGFRPFRSPENAIAAAERLMNLSKLHYVVEVDIKGFFDEVNHTKLLRQLWAMGIQDKKVLSVILAILKAPIRMPNGTIITPTKGTPQGGILSPLLANVVLNELDQWIDNQWQKNPVTDRYSQHVNSRGTINKGNGYTAMKRTKLKEMFIVRYADDVRIFCRTKTQAERTAQAVKLWLAERLKLQVSEEKTRVVNVKRKWAEFLGFKLKVVGKAGKKVVNSHICDKAQKHIAEQMKEQVKAIQHPANSGEQVAEICKYNAMVRGVHNYYQIATHANIDFAKIAWKVGHSIQARLKKIISKVGSIGKKSQDYKRYGKSEQVRYIGTAWLLPLSYVQHKNPMNKKRKLNAYTTEGRALAHEDLQIGSRDIMRHMAQNPVQGRSVEYNDNRVSLFAAQYGRCAITGEEFLSPEEVHCHHKTPRSAGGSDRYNNLVLVLPEAHRLIHAAAQETIDLYTSLLKLNPEQMKKINKLRQMANCEVI